MRAASRKPLSRRNLNVVMILTGVLAGMVGLTYAAVPLYRIFCEKTGFDGTPLRADGSTAAVQPIDRVVTVYGEICWLGIHLCLRSLPVQAAKRWSLISFCSISLFSGRTPRHPSMPSSLAADLLR